MGRSGSPSRNSTSTSHPMRGSIIEPEVCGWVTRIQHDALSSVAALRSQWNLSLQRPCSSVWMVSTGEPGGRDHHRRLGAFDAGHGGDARRSVLDAGGDQPGPAAEAGLAVVVLVDVGDRVDEILAVGVAGVGDFERVTGSDPRAYGLDLERVPLDLLGLEPHAREPLPVAWVDVAARIVVHLEIGACVAGGGSSQVEPGPLEVVVTQDERARPHLLLLVERVDGVAGLRQCRPAPEGQLGVARDGWRGSAVVGEDEALAVGGGLEVHVDPLVLEQPRNEGERALLILHAVLAHRVAAADPPLGAADAVGRQHLGHDVLDGLVLEDGGRHAAREKRQRGDDREGVARAPVLHALLRCPLDLRGLDHARELPAVVPGHAEAEHGALAHEGVEGESVGEDHLHLDDAGARGVVHGLEPGDPRGRDTVDEELHFQVARHLGLRQLSRISAAVSATSPSSFTEVPRIAALAGVRETMEAPITSVSALLASKTTLRALTICAPAASSV